MEIRKKEIDKSDIKVTYKIRITNTGEIAGSADEIRETIPDEFEFNKLDNNIKWNVEGRTLTTTELERKLIEPGKYEEIEITLRWKKGDSNLGNAINKVELSKVSNEPNFKEQSKEDNKAESKMIISISTGLEMNKEITTKVIVAILVVLILGGAVIIHIKNR